MTNPYVYTTLAYASQYVQYSSVRYSVSIVTERDKIMSKKTPQRTKQMAATSRDSRDDLQPTKERQTDEDLMSCEPAGSLAWSVLSPSNARDLMSTSPSDIAERLASIMCLTDHDCSMQQAAELDCYVAAVWFTRENGFTIRQTAMFFTILSHLIRNYKDTRVSLNENVVELKRLMSKSGDDFSQFNVFDAHQQRLVIDYITETVFQHSKLFVYLFSVEQPELVHSIDLDIEVPSLPGRMYPHPLEDAISRDLWERHVCPPGDPDVSLDAPLVDETVDETVANSFGSLSQQHVRQVVDEVAGKVLGKFESDIKQQLNERESLYRTKLERLEKIAN